jgi:hypothetical protein
MENLSRRLIRQDGWIKEEGYRKEPLRGFWIPSPLEIVKEFSRTFFVSAFE